MSEITSRPHIRSVSTTALAAAASGVVLTTGLVRMLVRGINAPARKVLEALPAAAAGPAMMESLSVLQGRFQRTEECATVACKREGIQPVEALQLETLAALGAAPFHIQDVKDFETKWRALANSNTMTDARGAQKALIHAVEQSHQSVFTNSLLLACQSAAIETGFTRIQPLPAQLGVIRFSATDSLGRSLVTEVHSHKGETAVETEVVGVTDGSCAKILDSYDAALERQGVKSGPAIRKFTGGICELAAAREFLRRKVKPTVAKTTGSTRQIRRHTDAKTKVRI